MFWLNEKNTAERVVLSIKGDNPSSKQCHTGIELALTMLCTPFG
jgi:hypothetical protein